MKFKTDDIVWFDESRGVVVSGYPGHLPWTSKPATFYDVYWPESGTTGTGVWESDLLSDAENRELLSS